MREKWYEGWSLCSRWVTKPVMEIRNTRRRLVWTAFEREVPWGYPGGVISLYFRCISGASYILYYNYFCVCFFLSNRTFKGMERHLHYY